jgi:hypothetical protein
MQYVYCAKNESQSTFGNHLTVFVTHEDYGRHDSIDLTFNPEV